MSLGFYSYVFLFLLIVLVLVFIRVNFLGFGKNFTNMFFLLLLIVLFNSLVPFVKDILIFLSILVFLSFYSMFLILDGHVIIVLFKSLAVVLFIFFIFLGFSVLFMPSRNKVLVCLVLFCFLIFLDVIGVIYFLSYVTSPLFVKDSLDFILLIVLSFLQSCLVIFYSFLGKYFLSYNFIYPSCDKKVNVSLERVVRGLDRVYLEEEDLDGSLGKRFVIRYLSTSVKVLKNTSCFGLCEGVINFFYGGKWGLNDFSWPLTHISRNYDNANNSLLSHLFEYSFFIYKELVNIFRKRLKRFMSYENFYYVFSLYADQVFYNCSLNSDIYFLEAEFNLDVKFWLDKLDSKGKFLDSFLQSFNNSSNIYSKSSFNFSLEEYDFNNPSHVSSALVPYSTLSLDYESLINNSIRYHMGVWKFSSRNVYRLRKVNGLSVQYWRIFCLNARESSEYGSFLLKHSEF